MLASAIPVGGDISNSIINLTQSLQGGENVYVWNGNGYYQYNYLGAGNGTGVGGISDWQDVSSPTNIPGDVALPPQMDHTFSRQIRHSLWVRASSF